MHSIFAQLYRVQHIMGTPIIVDVRDSDVAPHALDLAFEWLGWVDRTFSIFREDSEIGRINRGELAPNQAHPDVQAVLHLCHLIHQETAGYFDIRVPSPASGYPVSIDPSGIVKGWAVDRACELLEAAGARNYCICAGDDIRARGAAIPAQAWQIGIPHPGQIAQVAAVIMATDLAVATSSTHPHGHCVWDPFTMEPPCGVLSVTVTGPTLTHADAYATAICAMGRYGLSWAAHLSGYETMIVLDNHTVLSTPNFPFAPASAIAG